MSPYTVSLSCTNALLTFNITEHDCLVQSEDLTASQPISYIMFETQYNKLMEQRIERQKESQLHYPTMSHAASQQTGWNLKHTAGMKEVKCACPSLFLIH